MATFMKRETDNGIIIQTIGKTTERSAALGDGPDKERLTPLMKPVVEAHADAVLIRAACESAVAEWIRAQAERDARDAEADHAVRVAYARLVDWCGLRRTDRLVVTIFPRGPRLVIRADDAQPQAMRLLAASIRDSRDARLTPERKAELLGLLTPVIDPLAAALEAARTARVARGLAIARLDRAADVAWRQARDAYDMACVQLPPAVISAVFGPMLEPASAGASRPAGAPGADTPPGSTSPAAA